MNTINIRLKLNSIIETVVNKLNGTIADVITTVLYGIIGIRVISSAFKIIRLVNIPVIDKPNPNFHGVLILLSLATFYISLMGEYYKKPSRRLAQYMFIVLSISIFSLNYLAETFNVMFLSILKSIKNIDIIPEDLLIGNIRVVTLIIPASIIIPIFFLSIEVLKDEKSKDKLREYEVKLLLPCVHQFKDYTIDIEICKDLKSGLPCIAPEKIWREHAWLQGGTGSGKTSNALSPFAEQLLDKKAFLIHIQKTIAFKCLKNGIATIIHPISNKWFNENFDIDFIKPVSGKEKEFYEAFKEYTIGIIGKEEIVFEDSFLEEKSISLSKLKNYDSKYLVEISAYKNGMICYEEKIELTKDNLAGSYDFPFINVELDSPMYGLLGKSENELDDDDLININDYNKNILEERQEDINIQLKPKLKDLTYKVRVFSKGTGRLVLRNLGLTVVAPDGEFTSQVVEIGKEYGIKIHKIDPFMDEILRGNVAKFNPLKGDSPEKIGDIVASILVSMDIGPNSKTNPYFTNAGVRAIRNLVILLKISFPPLYNREPTLEDVLACLNNFDLVEEPVKYVEDNPSLLRRWKSIVDYFKTRFLDPPKDHDGKNTNSRVGSLKYNTQQAVEGMVNQLDNLLSREEIRYILCNEDESIDLAQILRKGECIAISTRQGNLGERLGRAFALFFILSLQNEVLNRYAENENPEIPHFIQIDEFPMYCNESTETFFSFSRKYKCSVTIAIQDMAQLKRISDEFGQTIFTNTTIKLLLPKSNIEDRKYWSEFFGSTKEMELTTGISTNSLFADNPSYNETLRGSLTETKNVSEEDIDNLNFQQLYYSYVDKKGRKVFGKGITDFMEVKRKPYMEEVFDFEPYAISEEDYNKTLVEKNEVMNKRKRLEKTDKLKKQAYNSSDQLFIDKEQKELNIVGESLFIDNSSTPPLLSAKNNKTVDLVLMEEVSIDQNKGIIFDTQEDNDKTKDLILSDEDSKYINEAPSYIVEDKENDKAKEKHDKNINIEFLIFEDDERSI